MDPETGSFGKRFQSHVEKGEARRWGSEGKPREQPDPLIRSAGVRIAFVWGGIKSGHTRAGQRGRWRGPGSCTAEGPANRIHTPHLGGGMPTFKGPGVTPTPTPHRSRGLKASLIHLPRSGTLRSTHRGFTSSLGGILVCSRRGLPPRMRLYLSQREAIRGTLGGLRTAAPAAPPNAKDWEVNVRARQVGARSKSGGLNSQD